jgi:pimeloyl-ACP methyl ester carboxylesterase
MPFNPLDVIRPVTRVGSRIAPRAVARLAFELFCRTQNPKRLPTKQKAIVERAEKRMVRGTTELVDFGGGKVNVYHFPTRSGETRGSVVLLHGWASQAAMMTSFIEGLTDSGFHVLAIDLPGHGRSSDRRLHVALAVRALVAVHHQTGPWHGMICHSFGGMVATALLDGSIKGVEPVHLQRLVLIAAPESATDILRNFGGFIGLGPAAQQRLEDLVQTVAGRSIERFKGADQLRRQPVTTLVLHAPDDKEVPFRNAEAFADAGPFVTLSPKPGLGHRRIILAPDVIAEALAHMVH